MSLFSEGTVHSKGCELWREVIAYTVCQRYGIETSDYSFGYIAGWSSDKETKELKGSLETIRATAKEMIESIDEKLKVLLVEKTQEQTAEATVTTMPMYHDVPVYRETANYAYEAGELETYRASRDANMACKEAIEAAISENYVDYRLSTRVAVEMVLEQFSEERVQYVLANTVQHNLHDGRYHDLRHSCASLLLANGVPMKQIQEWLGHSDFSTTANIYAHLDYSSKLTSADAMLNGLGLVPN